MAPLTESEHENKEGNREQDNHNHIPLIKLAPSHTETLRRCVVMLYNNIFQLTEME